MLKVNLKVVACLIALFTPSVRAADKVTYEDHLLPILRNECTSCHNPDKKKAGLDLSTYQSALAGGDSGALASAGDPDSSLLYKVVAHLEDPKMPKGKGKLADRDVNVFKQWIAGGLLENAGGKAVVSNKPKVNLAVVSSSSARPTGPIAMPRDLSLEPVVQTKRAGALMCLAASPWAPLVAVGGRHQVLLYNTNSLDLLGVIPFPEGDPYVAGFSRNGSTLLIGGGVSAKSGHVILFDVTTGKRITRVGDEFDAVLAADISPDQSTVALGGPGKTLKVYATSDGQLIHAIKKHTDWVTAAAFSPDGVLLASGDRAGGLWVWESHSGNEFYSLTGHKGAITAVAFRDDSNVMASASEDGTVKLWDMPSGKMVKNIAAHGPGVTSVGFTHDGRLVTSGRDRVVRIWKPDGSALVSAEAFPDIALHATFDGEASRIVAGDWSGVVRVFDAKTAKPVGDISSNPQGIGQRIANADRELKDAQSAYDKDAAAFNLATQRLTDAKSRMASLQAAQARMDLAAKQAALDKAHAAFMAARLMADQTQEQLDRAQKRVVEGRSIVNALEAELSNANESLGRIQSDLAVSRKQFESMRSLARSVGQVAQQLSDAARASRGDRDLALAADKAKAAFDSIALSMETADRAVEERSRDATIAVTKVAQARASLESEKSAIRVAPQSVAPLRTALESAKAQVTKLAESEQNAARDFEAAKLRTAAVAKSTKSAPATRPVAQKG